jgi:alcohol dehydrogenase (cytochrome c)
VCPGTLGGNEWNGAAYTSKLNLLVIPSNDNWCSEISKNAEAPSSEKANAGEGSYFGGPVAHPPFPQARGLLTGFDAATGKQRWRYDSPTPMVAGVALTASDLAFTGETGGYFDAIDAKSGRVLLRLNLGDSIQGGVITYSAHHVQYVAVVSGDGGVINHGFFPQIIGGNQSVTIFGVKKQ